MLHRNDDFCSSVKTRSRNLTSAKRFFSCHIYCCTQEREGKKNENGNKLVCLVRVKEFRGNQISF